MLVVADGTRLRFRPIDAGDRDGLASLFARLSPESRRRRFLSAKHELSDAELDYFSDIDHVRHEAIAAIDHRDGSIVGVARYALDGRRPAAAAHMAITVVDELQGWASARRLRSARSTVPGQMASRS
jgi:hypothetical protein